MKPVLEVCTHSVESAVSAERGGAMRLELCANLMIGGTSPDEDLFRMVRERVSVPVRVLLRPRCGDFLYTESEFELLCRQVKRFAALGADGIVIGVLTPEGDLDEERMAKLISLAGGCGVTLHRAFDVCRDPFAALETAKRLGVDTILTSGQQADCTAGADLLRALVAKAGEDVQILVGAGVNADVIRDLPTETVTACCLTPTNIYKEGSIGLPFPDTYIKIVRPDTDEEVPYGEEGEILLAGPTVMKEYMNHPDETAKTLRKHDDGLTWVYTGDLGVMDDEGFIYFRGRAKRMIISSGYNVYPGQIENILDANDMVQMSCVIGVPDAYKMQKVKAFVMLKPGVEANEGTRDALLGYCRKHVAKYAMPYDIEFRDELPKTLVGKVAYRVLEEEELKKIAREKEAGSADAE